MGGAGQWRIKERAEKEGKESEAVRLARLVTLRIYIFNLALDVMNNNQHGYPQNTGPCQMEARKKQKTQRKEGKERNLRFCVFFEQEKVGENVWVCV